MMQRNYLGLFLSVFSKFLYNASDLTNCRLATYRNFFHNADEKMWIIVNFSAKFLNISFVYLLFKPNDSKNNNF